MKIETIKTSRLLLRGFTKEDARFAMHIWNDREMGKYLPDPVMEEEDESYLKELEALGDDEECCYLIAVLQTTLEPIGTCSFILSEENQVCDIAYCVHKSYWNKGYATEMAQGIIHYAKTNGAKKITIKISKQNEPSNKVARKLGFTIVDENTYRKRGTDDVFEDYLYELIL